MNPSVTRVALVGCGGWAQRVYIPYLMAQSNIELTVLSGVADVREGQELAKKIGFKSYEHDWNRVAQKNEVDVAIISTPHAMHYEQVKAFLRGGKHVHVDKPPALHSGELEELIEFADANSLILSVHAQMKYMPGVNKLKAIIAMNFTSIYQVNAYIWQKLFSDFHNSWRSQPVVAGGGIMMDSGYHMIDTVHYVLDHRQSSKPTFLAHAGSRASDTIGLLTYNLGDAAVSISALRGAPQLIQGQRIEVFGDAGFLELRVAKKDGKNVSLVTYQNMRGDYEIHEFPHKYNYKTDPLELFMRAISTGNQYVVNEIGHNLDISDSVIKVLEQAYDKGESNGTHKKS